MRSLVFEGKTWLIYEQLRENDKKLGTDYLGYQLT
jgi:toxin YoeB